MEGVWREYGDQIGTTKREREREEERWRCASMDDGCKDGCMAGIHSAFELRLNKPVKKTSILYHLETS